jgi:general secretion pathway protein N
MLGQNKSCSLTPVVLAACVGVAVLNWYLLTTDIDISPIKPPGTDNTVVLSDAEDLPGESKPAAPGAFPETLARPLFRSSRRPPDPPKPDASAQAGVRVPRGAARLPTDLKLVGILKEQGQTQRALIRSGESPTGQWMEVGQEVQGWRLSQIEDASIFFEANGQKQKLSLFPEQGEAKKNE